MFEQTTVQQEEFVIPPQPKLEFKLNNENKFKAQTLIIAAYGPASLFIQSLISEASPTSKINFVRAKQTSLADIYVQANSNRIFITFNGQIQKMKEVYFSEFLSENFEVERILLFTHEYVNNLEKHSNNCLQYLSTSHWKDQVQGTKYSQGLMGIIADVLIWGQINKVPVACYVGIFKDYELNREIIFDVFGSLVGKHGLDGNTDISQRIKKYNMKKYSNNLYL